MFHPHTMQYLYAACAALGSQNVCLQDIGATLFSLIDRVEAMEKMHHFNVKIREIMFVTVEQSKYFQLASKALHPDCNLLLTDKIEDAGDFGRNIVSYSYMATSYAFDSTMAFVDWLAKSRFSMMIAWCSENEDEFNSETFGKRITLFSFPVIVAEMEKRGKKVTLLSANRKSHFNFDFMFTAFIVHDMDESTEVAYTNKLNFLIPPAERTEISEDIVDHFFEIAKTTEIVPHLRPLGSETAKDEPGNTFDFSNDELESLYFEAFPHIEKAVQS